MSEPDLPLPDGKTSFKPEELYRFTKVKAFVLRFWESEFPSLTPKKTGSEELTYSRADVEMILAIKQLLYGEGLTLVEARRRLSGEENREAKKKKKKKVSKKPAADSGGAVRAGKVKTAGAGAAAPKTGKVRGKRGLPGTDAARTAVSFEDLLPDSVGSEDAMVPGGTPSAGTSSAGPVAGKVSTGPEHREMRKKLSSALSQLREILTFLDKGDR